MSEWDSQNSSSDDDKEITPRPAVSSPVLVARSTPRKSRSSKTRAKRVGQYVIGRTIGKGSFGTVKVGSHIETGVEYALKFLSKKQVTDISEVEHLFRESAILTSLKCDNIIRLYEVIDDISHIVMVMELAQGGELFDMIKARHALPERETCRIFTEIVAGVEYCHRKNVIHRDLKLENILLVNGTVKVADFGLSNTAMVGKTEMGTICGTPSYLAPEQINRDSGVGGQADLWAMGIILYAMVAGFLPFYAKTTPALFKKILNLEFSYPDYFSDELQDLIGRLLTPDPDNRATIAEVKSHPWFLMELSDLAASSERQVSEDQVKTARDKANERPSPSPKVTKTKSTDSKPIPVKSPSRLNSLTPHKRIDSCQLPPVPASISTSPKHRQTTSVVPRPGKAFGSNSTVSLANGQFKMRPSGLRKSSIESGPTPVPSPKSVPRIMSASRMPEIEPEADGDDAGGGGGGSPLLPIVPEPARERRPLPSIETPNAARRSAQRLNPID